jgi:hypothetical protein
MDRDQNTADNAKVADASKLNIRESSINSGMTAERFTHMISQGQIEDAIAELDHAGYKYGDDASIDRVFHDKIAVIQKWMERMQDLSIADGGYAWQMIKQMDLPWDSVDSWWQDHKAGIVRRLLQYLKDERYEDVLGIMEDVLGDLDLKWPELAIIRRTAIAELDREQDDDIAEADDDEAEDEGPIWRRITPEEADIDELGRAMRRGSYIALKNAIFNLEQRDLDDGDIEQLLRTDDHGIVSWLDRCLREGLHDHTMLWQLWQLLEIGARWPELKQLAEKHKTKIVQHMLTDFRDQTGSVDLQDMDGHLRRLRELGITWPELAVISRSVNAELDRQASISESAHNINKATEEEQIAAITRQPTVLTLIRRPSAEVQRASFLHAGAATIFWLESVDPEVWGDNEVKRQVMRDMLEMMDGDPYSMREAARYFKRLRKLDCPWPELAAIEQSLRADRYLKESDIDLDSDIDLNNASDAQQRAAVDQYGLSVIKTVRKPSLSMQNYLILRNGVYALLFLNEIDNSIWTNPEIKHTCIRKLLTDIKLGYVGGRDLRKLVANLRELNCPWPEIDAIERSIAANRGMSESGDMLGYRISKGDLIDSMRDALRAGHNGAWGNNYAHMRPWNREHTVMQLSKIKPDIVSWISKYLGSKDPSNWRYGKQAVSDLDHLSVDWPELWTMVDQHKAAWLTPWLAMLKELMGRNLIMDMEDLEERIRPWQDMFAKHGINWPEIATILASIRSETAKIGHLGESQLAEGQDLRKYVRQSDRGTLYFNIPVDQTWRTSGQGHWSGAAKPVRVISIKQDIEMQGADGWISDLGVEFDPSTWDTEEDGLIYTDPGFLQQLRQFLMGLGVPRDIVSQISYSEQGMQDENFVSFDANALGEYVADQFVIGDAATMDARKTEIMRALLTYIRDGNFVRAAGVFNKLRELGATWPELGAVEQSLRADKNLSESALAKAAVEEAKQMLWHGLPDGNWWTFSRALDKMLYARVPQSEIHSVLDEYKEDILAQQNQLTQSDTASEVMAGVSNLSKLKDIGAGWPEIDQMITRNKRHIMRAALQEIKQYSTEEYGEELPHIYKTLRRLRVKWPEMAVIADGILTIQQLGEDEMPNSDKSNLMSELADDVNLLKKISVRLDFYRELLDKIDALRRSDHDSAELKKFEKIIRQQMQRRYDKIQQELASAHPHAVTHTYHDIEDLLGKAAAKDWLYDNRQGIAHALDRNLAHDGYMHATDILLNNLAGWGAKWPEILSVFAKNKDHLIRDMLEEIKRGPAGTDDLRQLQDRVALFKEFVPDWPELDIINHSLSASIKQLREDWHDVDSDDYDEVYGRVGSALQDIDNGLRPHMDNIRAEMVIYGLSDLVELLDRYDWLETPTPGHYNLDLAKQKPLFVRALLMGLRGDAADQVTNAIHMLEGYWHVKWPELDTINQSLRVGPMSESEPGKRIHGVRIPKTDRGWRSTIERFPWMIQHHSDPSDELKMTAIDKSPLSVLYIKDPNEEMQLRAVRKNPNAIEWIKNPSAKVQFAAVSGWPAAVLLIRKPEVAVVRQALLAEPDLSRLLRKINPVFWSDDAVKTAIIRRLLSDMKSGQEWEAKDMLVNLRKHKCPWPELDTINQSLRVGPMSESVPSYDEEAYRYAEEMAENLPSVAKDPEDAMHLFMHLADNPEVVGTEYAEYFQPHKTRWIRFLLTAMKGDEWTEDEIYTAVDMLQRMNLGWDELDTIQRSIGADFRG